MAKAQEFIFAALALLLSLTCCPCPVASDVTGISSPSKPAERYSNYTYSTPEQVHLSLGSLPNDIIVMWSTQNGEKGYVEYGKDPNQFYRALGTKAELTEQNEKAVKFVHRAELIDLTPGAHYSYRVVSGHSGTKSEVYSFDVPHNDPKKPHSFLVMADVGLAAKSLKFLVHEVINGGYEVVFHIGDFAYDLHSVGGSRGDHYMRSVSDFTAQVPYLTTPGDHESFSPHFYHYRYRFSMPNAPWPMTEESLWYSINIGYTHFISINTETFLTNSETKYKQIKWLENDLKKANKHRKAIPWIIVMGHKPMYCTASRMKQDCEQTHSAMREQLEDLFYQHGVNLYLSGHKHCYERSWPLYRGKVLQLSYINPRGPVYIINGAMGYEIFHDIQKSKPFWLAFGMSDREKELYSRLNVLNKTHLVLSAHDATNNEEVDNVQIIQREYETLGTGGFKQLEVEEDWKRKFPSKPFTLVQESPGFFSRLRGMPLFLFVFSLSFTLFLFLRHAKVKRVLKI